MKKGIFTFIISIIWTMSIAQERPDFQTYLTNPYLINPSFVGNSGYTEVGMTYKKQWSGFEDAPISTAFNLMLPTKGSLNFGLLLMNDKSILLSNNNLLLTLGYKASFGEDHHFKFGISGGMGSSKFDLANVSNPNDPALANIVANNNYLDGNAGVHYKYKGFEVGFALPRLFTVNPVGSDGFEQGEIGNLDEKVITASYQFGFKDGLYTFMPVLMYRMNELFKDELEVSGLLKIQKLIYLGGGYSPDKSLRALAGISLKEKLDLVYSYEKPVGTLGGVSINSHEIQLKIRFGEKKSKVVERKERKAKEVVEKSPKEKEEKENKVEEKQKMTPPVEEKEGKTIEMENLVEEPVKEIVLPTTGETKNKIEQLTESDPKESLFKMGKGFYVVVGSFEEFRNAENFSDQLFKLGFNSKYGFNSEKGLYYVFLDKQADKASADAERDRLKETGKVGKIWTMEIK
ncbi:PorP/SprF family type IX secretion system membrane protein [Flexithrix dorotheae]|uniref:PorP/SprF family type IX secretion system membrane protein n=1 Tax=Flexithrix dorotheae TaxID=70993 RepID=UPI00036C28CD|nr:PorP/SprF family type IX secretion system membrane protein [Flexithrix dorotheae]